MTRPVGLAHLTVLDLPPSRMIEAVATIGYSHVGLRLLAVTNTTPGYPLMNNPKMMRETKLAIRQTGISVNDIEFYKFTPHFNLEDLKPVLEAGAELGAKHLITAPYDPDLSRLAENLAKLGDFAAPFGIKPLLEFFPWTNVPSLASAYEIIISANNNNLGIVLDALHFDRSGGIHADITPSIQSNISLFHLCDAIRKSQYSEDELLFTARSDRLPPGEGDIDLSGILQKLPTEIPVSIEIPMDRYGRSHGLIAVAERVFKATQTFQERSKILAANAPSAI